MDNNRLHQMLKAKEESEHRDNVWFFSRIVLVLLSSGWLGVLFHVGPWRGLAIGFAGLVCLMSLAGILRA